MMKAVFQLLGAAAAVAAAGVGVAALTKKLGKKCPVEVAVDLPEEAEQDKDTADTSDVIK